MVVTVDARRAPECPSSDDLTRIVGELTGARATKPRTALEARVTFERTPEGHRATLTTTGNAGGERVLEIRGEGCRALGEAVATSLALVWDDLPDAAESPVVVAPPAPSPRGFFAGGIGGAWGVTRGLAPAAWLGGGLDAPFGWVQVSAHGVLPATEPYDPGTVHVQLFAGEGRACWAAIDQPFRVGLCGGLSLGAIRGRGDGYEASRTSTQLWLAATGGGEARVALTRHFFGVARADAILPIRRHAFTVDGAGTALLTPVWGVEATVGAGFALF